MADVELLKIEDHVEQVVSRITERYKELPKFEGVARLIGKQAQKLEDAVFDYWSIRPLDVAQGEQLETIWGDLVVQPRSGFDDDFYRILIYVKIGANFSQGGPEIFINSFKLLFGVDTVHYRNLGFAAVSIASSADFPVSDNNFIYRNLQSILASGVKLAHILQYSENRAFRFAGNLAEFGFGDVNDLPNTGGFFADVKRRS